MTRALPVLASTAPVSCAPLHGTLSLGACVARYLVANTGTASSRVIAWSRNGQSRGDDRYISCRRCAAGKQRTHNQEGKR